MGRVKGVKDAIKGAGTASGLLRWARATGKDLIEQFISDPVLKGVLGGQAGDNGLPPSQVSAFFQAGITHHYFEGGYYPVGGAFALPRAFTRALKDAGGELRLEPSVDEILIEDGRAIGVRLADGTEARSRYVISNADPEVTLGKLVGREHLSPKLRRKLDSVTYSVSALSLFFATDMDLREAGLDFGQFLVLRQRRCRRPVRARPDGQCPARRNPAHAVPDRYLAQRPLQDAFGASYL